MRWKFRIPRFAIIIIIIALIGLGIKGIKPMINGFNHVTGRNTGNGATEATQAKPSSEPIVFSGKSVLNELQFSKPFSYYQVIIESDPLKPLGWKKKLPEPEPVVQKIVEQPPPPRPEPTKTLVLTGIVNLDGQLVALVEDQSAGKAYFLREGDKLKDHVVEAVGEDSVVLVNNDSRLVSNIGSKTIYNSEGLLSMVGQEGYRTSPNIVKSEEGESLSPEQDSSTLSILEQMKARRRRELGQQ